MGFSLSYSVGYDIRHNTRIGVKAQNSSFLFNNASFTFNRQKPINLSKLWPHAGGREDFPAFDKTGRGCSKRGHFFSVCRSSNAAGNSRTSPAQRPLRVNHLEKRDTDSESDVEYLYAVRSHPMAAKPPMFNIFLDGIPIHVMADSGASVNILDERDFNKLSPRRKLIHTTTRIFPYQGSTPLPVLGKLTLTVTHKSYRQRAD